MNCDGVLRILQAVQRGAQQNSGGLKSGIAGVQRDTFRAAVGWWSPLEFGRSLGYPRPSFDDRRVRLLLNAST